MGLPVLIIGKSGSGKSTSMRNCQDFAVFNVAGKPLPFRNPPKTKNTDDYEVKVITGSYTGNGKRYYTNIKDQYSDKNETPLFPVSFPEQSKEDVTINIGAEALAVFIYEISTYSIYKPYLNLQIQYTIMKNFEYGYQNYNNQNTTKKECYVIQKNGSSFSGASDELVCNKNAAHISGNDKTGTPYSNYNYQYEVTAFTKLKVVSDDKTPSDAEIRISDLKTELLLDERINETDKIVGMKEKTINDVQIGMTIYRATIEQYYYYKRDEFTEVDEKGFVTANHDTNKEEQTYGFIAFVKC